MEGMTEKDASTSRRYTVPEAARVLGIGTDAVRKRIARGTISHEKDDNGRVYVYLDTRHDEGHDTQAKVPELVESLREQIGYLQGVIATRDEELRTRAEELRRRDQDLERRDRIIAALTERIPQALEPPSGDSRSPQPVEEAPERAEPHSATGEAQEDTERPQQRSGWLAPVDELPWWQYLLGLGLISLEVSILGLAFAYPASFGFWVGLKRRNLSLWRNLVPMGLIAGAIGQGMIFAVRPGLWAQSFLFLGKLSLVDVLFVMFVLFIPALSFISGAIIGRALQRRTAGAYASLTPDIEDPSSAPRPTTPGDGWSPRKQAILGFAGTLIAALLSLIATLVSTIMASGG